MAVPAFLALTAEPLFLLVDAAMVGRLGTAPLAGIGVASTVLTTMAGVFVFLAYGSTAAVARRSGAGDLPGALRVGVDGGWLALILGVLAGGALAGLAEPIATAFGASSAVTEQAATYLRVSAAGLPGMLVVLAATGVLRGLQDTRTPLIVAVVGFSANAVLGAVLVFGAGLGIAGSALGTVVAQTGMAVALVTVVVRGVRRHGGSLRPHPWQVLDAARNGVPLLVRTLALRSVFMATTWVAASGDDTTLAAYQVAVTVWTFLAFALDALAIAAQTLTGHALGAGDRERARTLTTLMMRWGVWCGIALGVLLAAGHQALPALFTTDPAVQRALAAALLVVALLQPLSGLVFALDGVLIGAGDARWLAWAMTVQLALYLPVALAVRAIGITSTSALWGLGVFMAIRGAGLIWRARGTRWMLTGSPRT
ncbi:MAG: MATE family efflux transporter [Angustibacter sp.]